MKRARPAKLSLAEQTGIAAILVAALLLPIAAWLSVIPLFGFLLACVVAPFVPKFGFFLDIVSRGNSSRKAVALSFDDGPDPASTPYLLKLLTQKEIRATFFMVGQKARSNQDIVGMVLEKGHSIGNHSYSHAPFLMLKSSRKLKEEIRVTQEALHPLGVAPLAFRPPVGITNPRLKKVLADLGMYAVNFTHRSADLGNRHIRGLAQRILKRVQAGEIIVLHDTRPKYPQELNQWLEEIERLISGIKAKGLSIVPLEELIGRSVMAEKNRTSR
mgnify:CR=1 FL=1